MAHRIGSDSGDGRRAMESKASNLKYLFAMAVTMLNETLVRDRR